MRSTFAEPDSLDSELVGFFAEPAAVAAVRQARTERDPRPVYRLLGERRLLAPAWPERLGGRDGSLVQAGAVAEQLAARDVPDLLHVISVQTVGNLLLRGAPESLVTEIVPRLAAGRAFAAVLFTEPGAGSDLSSVITSAIVDDDAVVLHGEKVYGLVTSLCQHGLCLARVEGGRTPYDGLMLVLLDLTTPGVTITPVPSAWADPFHRVGLEDVRVPRGRVVAPPGQAWPLLLRTLALERTGIDYYSRARRWYALARERAEVLEIAGDADVLAALGRFGARLNAARLLAYRTLSALDEGEPPDEMAATSKWYASELAADLAGWTSLRLGGTADDADPLTHLIREAALEAPGMRISGGTSEMMLRTLAGACIGGAG
ncbi:MAG: acyl-CoA dehydrogenase family protein [Nocardioides sp.]|uniref:acyl-CoA dehydrogenase family protein n=1 Tax=Nocardioides sp. TaxID=35761 RepID=UPI0039E62157